MKQPVELGFNRLFRYFMAYDYLNFKPIVAFTADFRSSP